MVYYMLKPIPIHLLHLGSLPVIYRALAMSTAIGGNPARCVPSCGTVAWRVLAGPAGETVTPPLLLKMLCLSRFRRVSTWLLAHSSNEVYKQSPKDYPNIQIYL